MSKDSLSIDQMTVWNRNGLSWAVVPEWESKTMNSEQTENREEEWIYLIALEHVVKSMAFRMWLPWSE